MSRGVYMHLHVALRSTVQVVTAEDMFNATALVCGCFALVKLYSGVAAHVSSNAVHRGT